MTRPRTHQPYHSGEKLLLSLARIILKRPKVLLMDMGEACRRPTSSSSTPTSPPSKFSTSTVLMFARRPLTAIDYVSFVVILDAGRIFEPGRLATLIADRNSRFYRICKSAGREGVAVLKKRAGVALPTPFEAFWLCQIRDTICGSYHAV
ncbi:hypothetical protein PISMIDRAFT_102391 [Pisolithus microcarpus 441]|uniref:Uncharacterized protein n=1 Tax=Pisolithus microcarpus 441 TaxID=765257 RepID=A0A0C9ZRQ4_9AGAM|nr:hypothetical protein BKA83DRAFT_102391 [Pisolithus microcarpus]KIK22428.1 hypothetical protein PISMIDRAFT_102391 [Pisolithus microcarpus 441]